MAADRTVRVIKVFVSSPADVTPERGRVQAVAAKLNRDYEGLVRFDTVLWEEHFYRADRSFQPQIPEAVACDMLVSIFWTRIGTELPTDFARMPNGKPYPSGTAYELLTALEASKAKGVPDVYVFRKTADAVLPMADIDRRRQAQTQLDALEVFWNEWFKSEQGHFKAAFQTFADTDEFEHQVERLLRQWLETNLLLGARIAWPRENGSPFRGLAPFEAGHSAVFFGRSRDTDRAVARFKSAAERTKPFLLVMGASGAGKSSLVRAGLVPRLTTPGVVAGIDVWRLAVMRPGSRPFDALAEALFADKTAEAPPALPELAVGDSKTPAELAALLRYADATAVRPLLRALERISAEQQKISSFAHPVCADLVLVVDQLDDLFTADISAVDRAAFAKLLRMLVASERVWVVTTLRAALYESFLAEAELKALKDAGANYDLAPPGPAELAEIVRKPADAAALVYEHDESGERLDEKLLREAAGADTLPLLQFTLQRLYEAREEIGGETRLTHAAYAALGGIDGAIDQAAERALSGLGAAELAALPRLLRQLAVPVRDTTVGGGRSTLTIRAVPLAETAPDAVSRRLADALIEARILLLAEEGIGPTIRLAHQRVLESWQRARAIVDGSEDFFRVRDEVEGQRRRWEASGRKAELLLARGLPLAEAERIVETYGTEIEPELRAFIAASDRHARQRQRLTAAAAVVFGVVAIAASVLGVLAFRSEQRADRQRNDALLTQSRFLADLSGQRIADDPTGAMLLALEALPDAHRGVERPYASEAEAALFSSYRSLREAVALQGHERVVMAVAYSADGRRIVTGSGDNTARIWDAQTGREIAVFKGHASSVSDIGLSPDGRRLVTASQDGTARLWNVENGEEITALTEFVLNSDFQFSPDGRRILVVSKDNAARIWDSETGNVILVLRGHEGSVNSAEFSSDGRRVVTASSDKTARIWNAETGDVIVVLQGHEQGVNSVKFSPDNRRVVTASSDKTARIWDAESGKQVAVLRGHEAEILKASFSQDGQRVVTVSKDGTTRLWDANTGIQVAVFKGISGIHLSPDGQRLVTISDDTAVLSNAHTGKEIAVLQGDGLSNADFSHDGRYLVTTSWISAVGALWSAETGKKIAVLKGTGWAADFSPDDRHVVTGSWSGAARVWDVEERKDVTVLDIYGASSAAFNPDGQRVFTESYSGEARVWDAETGAEILPTAGDERNTRRAFSQDGRRLLTTSQEGMAHLWDLDSGQQIAVLGGDGPFASGVKFSRDGRRVVTASWDGTARLWDAETGTTLHVLDQHKGPVRDAEFSPDGRRVVTASSDRTARIWDAETGGEIVVLRGHEGSVERAVFSPDGRRVLTNSADKTVRVWDAETGKAISVLAGHEERVVSAVFSRDGLRVETVSGDETARIWDAETGKEVIAVPGRQYQTGDVAFSPDGRRVVTISYNKGARLWDTKAGREVTVLEGHSDNVRQAGFSPDGRRVVTASNDKTARIWDAETGKESVVLKGHTDSVIGATFSPEGTRVVTYSDDHTARIWDAETGNEIAILKIEGNFILSAAFSEDGRHILTSASKTAQIWDAETGKQLRVFTVDEHDHWQAFSSDGRRVVTVSSGEEAQIWDTDTGKEIANLKGLPGSISLGKFSVDGKRAVTSGAAVQIWNVETGSEVATLRGPSDPDDVAFSPDGRHLVTGKFGTHQIWDAQNGEEVTLPPKVTGITFRPDGRRVLLVFDDTPAQIWDPETSKTVALLNQDSKPEGNAAFSPDGRRVAIPALDKSVRIWDVEAGKEIAVLVGHSSWVKSVAFSADGRRIVTASNDKTARVWDAETGKLIAILAGHDDTVRSAVFSPDGGRILTTSYDSTTRLWSIFRATQDLVDQAKAAIPSCLSPKERERNFLDAAPPAWCIDMEKWPYHTQAWKDWLAKKRANLNPPLPESPRESPL